MAAVVMTPWIHDPCGARTWLPSGDPNEIQLPCAACDVALGDWAVDHAEIYARHVAEHSRLVTEAVIAGRACSICPASPMSIVLLHEVELLVCAAHADKARTLGAEMAAWLGPPDPARILHWDPHRPRVGEPLPAWTWRSMGGT